jgi:hypothetical protein
MTQILNSIPTGCSNPIFCCYVNTTNQIQVARISNIPSWYFERVVFPGQRLLFETPIEASLEIHTGTASAILADRIACQGLQVFKKEEITTKGL